VTGEGGGVHACGQCKKILGGGGGCEIQIYSGAVEKRWRGIPVDSLRFAFIWASSNVLLQRAVIPLQPESKINVGGGGGASIRRGGGGGGGLGGGGGVKFSGVAGEGKCRASLKSLWSELVAFEGDGESAKEKNKRGGVQCSPGQSPAPDTKKKKSTGGPT